MQALWMVLAAFLFALMSICVKYASQDFNAAEIVFYRGLVSMVMLAIGLLLLRRYYQDIISR